MSGSTSESESVPCNDAAYSIGILALRSIIPFTRLMVCGLWGGNTSFSRGGSSDSGDPSPCTVLERRDSLLDVIGGVSWYSCGGESGMSSRRLAILLERTRPGLPGARLGVGALKSLVESWLGA